MENVKNNHKKRLFTRKDYSRGSNMIALSAYPSQESGALEAYVNVDIPFARALPLAT